MLPRCNCFTLLHIVNSTNHFIIIIMAPELLGPTAQVQGHPMAVNGFPLNALKTLFRLSRVLLGPLEMHSSTPSYKICICSVILGQLESFRNYKGFSIIFPKILDAI